MDDDAPSSPGHGDTAAPATDPWATAGVGDGLPFVPPTTRPRGALLAGLAGGVAAVMALSTTLVVLSTPKTAEATVIDSVQNTLADRTAHVDMTLSIGTAGQQATASGSGAIDFSRNAADLHLEFRSAAQQVDVEEILVNQVAYVGGTFDGGSINQLSPGKSWISVDLGSLTSAMGESPGDVSTDTNPAAMLRLLAQQGNTVVPLGSSTIDDTKVLGYKVTFDPARVSSEIQSQALPSWLRQATAQIDFSHLSMKVYIDGSNMVRRYVIDMVASEAGAPVDAEGTLDLSQFGTAVDVVAPPSDQVVPLSQLLPAGTAATAGETSTSGA